MKDLSDYIINRDDKFLKNSLFLFLVWPFRVLLYSLKNYKHPASQKLFWLFCIYFGFVFIIDDPGGSDSARYAEDLYILHSNLPSFKEFVNLLYATEGGILDIYQPLVTWLVALFTGDARFLFAFFAAVFGHFYAKNIWMILDRVKHRMEWVVFIFILSFALINPIWNINGVRMWTAAQIFLYGNLRYLLYNDKKGLYWSASSVFVHFSFLLPNFLLFVWLFLPLKLFFFFSFYVFATLLKEVDLSAIGNLLSFLPDILQPRVESYTNEEYAQGISKALEQNSWHVHFAKLTRKIVLYVWVSTAFYFRNVLVKKMPEFIKLFSLALFIGGVAQIASLIPSGGRFLTLSNSLFFALFIFILLQQKDGINLKWIKIITVPFLIFSIFFNIRMGFDYIGILTFVGNPLLAIIIDDQTPLIEFVKSIL